MWWLQTTGYHLGGLIWLIVVAVIFLIALVALSVAGSAMTRARHAMIVSRDRDMMDNPPGSPSTLRSPGMVPPADAPASVGDSLKILHERYARGDISREEYLRLREDLMGRPAA